MKYVIFDIKSLIILTLLGIILFMQFCGKNPTPGETIKLDGKKYEILKRDIDTLIIKKDSLVYKKGKDIYHDTTIYLPIPMDVDTNKILEQYYSYNIFKDSLKLNDSLGLLILTDTISENKIKGRLWNVSINQKLITDRMIVKELPKNQVYMGLNAGFNRQALISNFGPNLLLKTKKDKVYSFGILLNQNRNISVQAGIYWKLKLKK